MIFARDLENNLKNCRSKSGRLPESSGITFCPFHSVWKQMYRCNLAALSLRANKKRALISEDSSVAPEVNTGLTNQGSHYCINLFSQSDNFPRIRRISSTPGYVTMATAPVNDLYAYRTALCPRTNKPIRWWSTLKNQNRSADSINICFL